MRGVCRCFWGMVGARAEEIDEFGCQAWTAWKLLKLDLIAEKMFESYDIVEFR